MPYHTDGNNNGLSTRRGSGTPIGTRKKGGNTKSGKTSNNAGHVHKYQVDSNGNGWALEAYHPQEPKIFHKHKITNWVVESAQSGCYPNCKELYGVDGVPSHIHTINGRNNMPYHNRNGRGTPPRGRRPRPMGRTPRGGQTTAPMRGRRTQPPRRGGGIRPRPPGRLRGTGNPNIPIEPDFGHDQVVNRMGTRPTRLSTDGNITQRKRSHRRRRIIRKPIRGRRLSHGNGSGGGNFVLESTGAPYNGSKINFGGQWWTAENGVKTSASKPLIRKGKDAVGPYRPPGVYRNGNGEDDETTNFDELGYW